MRERLIELINKSMNNCPPNVGGCRNCPYFIGSDSDWCDDSASIADHLIAHGVTVQECGNWKYYHKQNKAVCTSCSFERDLDANFGKAIACPNCGAYMPQPPKGE